MRGLALATLFLGLCLLVSRDARDEMTIASIRVAVFVVALIVILFGV